MADVTLQATITHALSATGTNDPTAEVQMSHWNQTHAASIVMAAAALFGAFSNANGFEFGTSNAGAGNTVITGSYTVPSVPAQSVQTQAAGAIAGTGFTSTSTAGTDIKATVGTNGVSMAVPAYLTAAVGGGGAGTGFTSATTAGTQVKGTLGTDGLSLAVPAYLTTAQPVGAYLTTARGSTDAVGLNTALTANGVAWTVNSSGISLNVPAFLTTARGSTDAIGLNTAKSNVTWTADSRGLSLDARGYAGTGTSATNASITLDSNGLAINVAAPGGGAAFTKSRFNPFMEAVGAAGQMGQGTLHIHPVPDPDNFCYDRMYFDVQGTEGTQTNSTGSYTISMWAGFYTRTGSSLSLYASSSTTLGLTKSGTVRASVNNGGRVMTMGWTTTITQADLWMGIVSSTASAGQNIYTLSQYVASDVNSNFSGVLGAASAATAQNVLGLGVYTAATAGLPNSIAFSQINGTNSNFLRVPLYYFVSGTA